MTAGVSLVIINEAAETVSMSAPIRCVHFWQFIITVCGCSQSLRLANSSAYGHGFV
jgi:hypothetical protein